MVRTAMITTAAHPDARHRHGTGRDAVTDLVAPWRADGTTLLALDTRRPPPAPPAAAPPPGPGGEAVTALVARWRADGTAFVVVDERGRHATQLSGGRL